MFKNLSLLPDDPILNLSRLFHEDKRTHKIDVGVGIYQNEAGETPVMQAVKEAEQRVWQTQNSKKYLGLSGNPDFNQAMSTLILDDCVEANRIRVQQSVAGTGALGLIGATLFGIQEQTRVWLPDPTWGNHVPIFAAAGFEVKTYPYYDAETATLRRDAFFAALEQLGPKDVVLLHGCCHNPSGEDLTHEDWEALAKLAVERGFLPVIDLAYAGFGDGLQEDLYGVRLLARSVGNILIAVSCSKNFGLYRDRAGAVIAVGENSHTADALLSHFNAVSRSLISMPADHGAAVVATILHSSDLYQMWLDELGQMSNNIRQRRTELANALYETTGEEWAFITRQRGMFSLLPLGKERVRRLREEEAVYIVGTGRINVAGLHSQADSQALAQAIARCLS